MTEIYRFTRDIQSRFGFALEVKASLQRLIRRIRKVPFEPEFCILSHLQSNGRCILDVGANRGQSIEAIRLFQPATRIFAFEPNKPLFQQLTHRYYLDQSLHIRNFGLGRKMMEAPLFVPYYRNFMYDGLASFSLEEATGWLNNDTVWNFQPKLLRIEEQTCIIKVLDDLFLSPFFLKIDVQGYEVNVLEGGEHTVARNQPVILVENDGAADAWLRERGWSQFGWIGGRFIENRMGRSNSIYLNLENLEHQSLLNAYV